MLLVPEIDFVSAFLWFSAFLFSTTVHEAMHAWAAYRGGDPTAYHGGQVSLSPIPHVAREPIGMLVVPLLTSLTQGWAIGWASTPYDPVWATRHPKRAALMAAAGPAGNLLIALAALILLKAGLMAGWFQAPRSVNFERLVETSAGDPTFIGAILSVFLMLNVLLCAFNLIPLPPLDGASIITVALPPSAAAALREWMHTPMFQIAGLLIAWRVFPVVTDPLFQLVLTLVHPEASYR
jgi:Zn-dependent protease